MLPFLQLELELCNDARAQNFSHGSAANCTWTPAANIVGIQLLTSDDGTTEFDIRWYLTTNKVITSSYTDLLRNAYSNSAQVRNGMSESWYFTTT